MTDAKIEYRARYERQRKYFSYVWPLYSMGMGLLPNLLAYLLVKYKFSKNDSTLEIGIGRFPFYTIYNRGRFVGIDWIPSIVKSVRRYSKRFGPDEGLEEHIVADANRLPFRDGVFDKVVSVFYIEDVGRIKKEITRTLKKGGKYIRVLSIRSLR